MAASPIYYTVVRGDSLSKIASRFGVTVAMLVEWNSIENPNLIRVGQVLVVGWEEEPAPDPEPEPEPPSYTKEEIDAAFQQVSADIEELAGVVTDLASTVGNVVASLGARADDLETRAEGLEERGRSVEIRVDGLDGEVGELKSEVEKLKGGVAALESRVRDLEESNPDPGPDPSPDPTPPPTLSILAHMSTFSVTLVDDILTSKFVGEECELRLHVDNPGIAGTANRAMKGSAPAVGKPLSFSEPDNHDSLPARTIKSTNAASWTGSEIDSGQEITHYTIWADGKVLDIGTVDDPVTTTAEGVLVEAGGVRVSVAAYLEVVEPGPDPEEPGVGPYEGFTPPAGATVIATTDNAASIINSASAGAKFVFAAGVHNIGTSITTKSGMELYGEYGAILDGGGGNRRIILGGSGGRMENLVVRNFVPPLQDAAVVGQLGSGTDMVLSHCEFYGNTIALYTKSGWQVLNCDIHHQLQLGVSGSGNNVLMEGCEIHHNNTEGHDSHWEAGATKFVHARDLVIRNCYSHDNDGPGFWTDGTVYDALIEDCVAENDRGPGIDIEITYGAKVLNNRVVNCGHGWTSWTDGAGILVTSSPDVEVAYNEVIDSRMGIVGQDRNRGSGQSGPYLLQGLWVHHNKTNGLTGIVSQDDRSEPYGEWNNQFDFNEYLFAKSAARFYWANGPLRSGTQWQGYGNDLNGTWES